MEEFGEEFEAVMNDLRAIAPGSTTTLEQMTAHSIAFFAPMRAALDEANASGDGERKSEILKKIEKFQKRYEKGLADAHTRLGLTRDDIAREFDPHSEGGVKVMAAQDALKQIVSGKKELVKGGRGGVSKESLKKRVPRRAWLKG